MSKFGFMKQRLSSLEAFLKLQPWVQHRAHFNYEESNTATVQVSFIWRIVFHTQIPTTSLGLDDRKFARNIG